jgi:hypothetical protein
MGRDGGREMKIHPERHCPTKLIVINVTALLGTSLGTGRFELFLPAGNYSIRARVADAAGVCSYAGEVGRAALVREANGTDASSLAAMDNLAARLDGLSQASQLLILATAVAETLDASAGAAAAIGSAVDGAKGKRLGRRLLGSSSAYRNQVLLIIHINADSLSLYVFVYMCVCMHACMHWICICICHG